jgi:hypothetical protein
MRLPEKERQALMKMLLKATGGQYGGHAIMDVLDRAQIDLEGFQLFLQSERLKESLAQVVTFLKGQADVLTQVNDQLEKSRRKPSTRVIEETLKIPQMRKKGMTWEQIGKAFGISGNAARNRQWRMENRQTD